MALKNDEILKRNWLVVSKLTEGIWRVLTRALEGLKNLNGLLFTKVNNDWAYKVQRGVLFDGTEDWCKIWRQNDYYFQKWREEFGKFSLEDPKVSELGLWWDSFIQSRKCMSLKFTGELQVIKMKNDAKFEQELTCQFKIDVKEFEEFDPSTRKFRQKFAL